MRGHDVLRRQGGRELPHDFEERFIVGDENLDHVAELRDFGGRADKILFWARRSVPDEDLESAMTEPGRDPRPDNSEADQTDVFVFGARHGERAACKRAAASARSI